jgi:hypothetical protein
MVTIQSLDFETNKEFEFYNVVSSTPRHERHFELTTLVAIGTNCTGSCKSNYFKITIAPQLPIYYIQNVVQNIFLNLFCTCTDIVKFMTENLAHYLKYNEIAYLYWCMRFSRCLKLETNSLNLKGY